MFVVLSRKIRRVRVRIFGMIVPVVTIVVWVVKRTSTLFLVARLTSRSLLRGVRT